MLVMAILAGGLATRLRPMTNAVPKSMIEICGKPFIDWQLKLLAENGLEKIVICLGHNSEMIKDFVGDGSKYGLQVEYSFDGETQLGTGGALRKALPLLGEEFMVVYGDSYLPTDFKAIAAAFHASKKPALMTVFYNDGAYDVSNVLFLDGVLKNYSKTVPLASMTHIDYGLSVFKRSVFRSFPEGLPFDLSDVCTNLSSTGSLGGFEVYNRFYEIGSFQGIADFTEYARGAASDI